MIPVLILLVNTPPTRITVDGGALILDQHKLQMPDVSFRIASPLAFGPLVQEP